MREYDNLAALVDASLIALVTLPDSADLASPTETSFAATDAVPAGLASALETTASLAAIAPINVAEARNAAAAQALAETFTEPAVAPRMAATKPVLAAPAPVPDNPDLAEDAEIEVADID